LIAPSTVRGLLLTCMLLAVSLPACSRSADSGDAAPADKSAAEAQTLLYQRGLQLHRLNLDTGADRVVRTLPPAEINASPTSSWLALVGSPEGVDFAARPRLSLLQPDSGRRLTLGPGLAPLWRPDGKAVAYLRPVEERRCEVESCSGRVEVAIASLSGAIQTVMAPGHWTLLSWAGSDLLLGNLEDSRSVTMVGRQGPPQKLPVPSAKLWGASPDGRWVVVARRRGADYVALSPEGELGRRRTLVTGGRLAEGAWSPDSDRVAGVLLEETNGALPLTGVVLSSPEASGRRLLPGSRGAAGAPMWSADGGTIAFPQATGEREARLRAKVCVLKEPACDSWLHWTDEVRLLRLE
jgi:hypothetical protein